MLQPLPVDAAIPALREALAGAKACVLEAPPGAGKTTRVPVALLDEPWLAGRKIVMLQPRRIAARAAAARMAAERGEAPGETIGYAVRLDARIGPRTRIEVLTEGLLTRRLQSDPALTGVGLVIFDEFHERSLQADLGLALTLETQSALNEELRILVMSATLDGARVAALLRGAPVVRAQGRMFPVRTIYGGAGPRPADAVALAVRRALAEAEGGVLAFLPGEGEIRAALRALEDLADREDLALMPLYGGLPADAQDRAIRPAPQDVRKIVLATAIAETSVTIEDVRAVIDCGLQRVPRYDPATGFTRLVTQDVSLASADQRRGRAGRVAPGVCYRLWEEAATRALRPFSPPEILGADLAQFALDLAAWGVADPGGMAMLDQPPRAAWDEARELLTRLEALDPRGRITPHGKALAEFGAHPRLAHMMVRAAGKGEGAPAAALAAILTERDVLRSGAGQRDRDLRLRLDALASAERDPRIDRAAAARAQAQAKAWRARLGAGGGRIDPETAGRLTALAFPERVAMSRGRGSFRMVSGRGATMDEVDALAASPFLAVAALDGAGPNARVHLAAPLTLAEIEEAFAGQIHTRPRSGWDRSEKAVICRMETRLGALVLRSQTLAALDREAAAGAVIEGIREMGLGALPWPDGAVMLRARIAFARRLEPDTDWPAMTDEGLLDGLERWLAPFLDGVTRASHFAHIDTLAALKADLGWERNNRLDALAPEAIRVPSGSFIPIDYAGEHPVLAVRLQEMFGLVDTPTVGRGRVPVTLHLLSPARRPVQVTRDLKSFWANGYPQVKKDLKGRYPKHFWPDDPWTAEATARAKPRPG